MRLFVIDIKNSGKGERKKAVAWLRSQGHTVKKRKDETIHQFNYLFLRSVCENIISEYDFEYHVNGPNNENVEILTLPEDDAKFREYTRREEPIKTDTEERITHKLIHQEAYNYSKDMSCVEPNNLESFKLGMYRALELIGYKINKNN